MQPHAGRNERTAAVVWRFRHFVHGDVLIPVVGGLRCSLLGRCGRRTSQETQFCFVCFMPPRQGSKPLHIAPR
jgi:hypothetical protein